MTLKEHIDDIRKRLEQKEFTSEAAVRQGIIERLLGALAWPTFDTKIVFPEYGVEGRRVDYALCHPVEKPRVFIEVKQVGNIEGAERQLFEYAFHSGVPIAILTDGQKWRFFYPIGQGEYRERKVHEFDLIENDSEESLERLNRYLNYEAVQTGEAVKAIEEDYRNVSKQRQIERRLPEAWSKLLEDADEFSEFLLEAMAGKTESLCGAIPTQEQVLTFLKSLERKTELKPIVTNPTIKYKASPAPPNTTGIPPQQRKPHTCLRVTMPNEEVIDYYNAAQTFVEIIVKEVIEKLRPEEVSSIYPTIISTTSFSPKAERQVGQFYINLKTATIYKKRILETIADHLGIQMKIEVVEK